MQGLHLPATLSASERKEALTLRFADLIKKSNNPNKNTVRIEEEKQKTKNNSSFPADRKVRKEQKKEVADQKNHNREVKKSLIKINLIATTTDQKKNLINGAENKKKRPLIVGEKEENNHHLTKKKFLKVKEIVMSKDGQEDTKKESKIEAARRASREALDNMKMEYDFEQNKTSMIEFDKLLGLPYQNYYYYSRDTFFAEFYPRR